MRPTMRVQAGATKRNGSAQMLVRTPIVGVLLPRCRQLATMVGETIPQDALEHKLLGRSRAR
jgi:hypothetical protein